MPIFNLKKLRFRLIISSIVLIGFFIVAYCSVVVINFNAEHVGEQSQLLEKFSQRAQSRVNANYNWFFGKNPDTEKFLGDSRLGVAKSLDALKAKFPNIALEKNVGLLKTTVKILDYRGPFKVPEYVLIRTFESSKNQIHYAYMLVNEESNPERLDFLLVQSLVPISIMSLAIVLVIFIIELKQMGKINQTVKQFSQWSDSLTLDSKLSPPPDFESDKFNYIAHTLSKSLSGISSVMERELSFAKYTSHELRGSIAALSANMEVLDLMMKNLSKEEQSVLKSMNNAVSDIRYQMEALLWLSNESLDEDTVQRSELIELVNKALEDNSYLREGKYIELELSNLNRTLETHPVLFQIVLNNLVRNAFQNTQHGMVRVSVEHNTLFIANKNFRSVDEDEKPQGFGIGLILVQKLIHKLSLKFEYEDIENGRIVSISLD